MIQNTNGNKVLLWALTALSSIASYVSFMFKSQLDDIKSSRQNERSYYQTQIENRDKMIVIERKEKDSLQGLLLSRTDASFDEIRKLLDIKDKKSTIIIKPKK